MSATEELRRLLDERGVEYETDDAQVSDTEWYYVTKLRDGCHDRWTYEEPPDCDLLVSYQYDLGAEEAIAATLGPCNDSCNCTNGERTGERMYIDPATLGDARPTKAESSGTLTAEKVRELIEESSRQYPSPTDPYVWLTEYDWQVIADELNATLGRRTCYVMTIGEFNGEGTEYYDICSNCSYEFFDDDPLNFCPNCGRRIEVDDG